MKKKEDNEIKQANLLFNFCRNSGIEHKPTLYGNNYFNDNFNIIGFNICIDFLFSPYDEAVKKNADFLKFMRNKKDLVCVRTDSAYNPHFLYQVFLKSDYIALQEHAARVNAATNNFGNWYHFLREKYGAENIAC